MKVPGLRSSYDKVGGLVYFGRMLDKIRLHAQGRLPGDYNRGTAIDARMCKFLKIEYEALVKRMSAGGTDDELLEWCYTHGRRPTEDEIQYFDAFLAKRGWRDDMSAGLEKMKREGGFEKRDDIQTVFDFHKADEEAD